VECRGVEPRSRGLGDLEGDLRTPRGNNLYMQAIPLWSRKCEVQFMKKKRKAPAAKTLAQTSVKNFPSRDHRTNFSQLLDDAIFGVKTKKLPKR